LALLLPGRARQTAGEHRMKKRLGLILRVVISVGILAYLFNSIFQVEAARYFEAHQLDPDTMAWPQRAAIVWTQGPQALWAVFKEVNPGWFVLAVASVGVVCVCGIVRWQIILRVQGLDLSFTRASSIFFIGMFFNAFMLGSTGGDLVKALYVSRETHHKKAEAVATVVIDRLIGLLALFVIALTMMGIYHHRVFDDPRLRTAVVVTLGAVIGTVMLMVLSLWKGFADRVPTLRAVMRRLPYYDTIKRVVDAFRVYTFQPGVLARAMVLSFGVHLCVMACIYFVGRGLALRTTHGLIDYLLYLPIINTIAAIPISISGFGVRELMYVEMFGKVGLARPEAVTLSLVGYLAQLVWSLVGGVFYLTHRRELPPAEVIAQAD
jgi:uncharacterized protein (TIRG00374 family)